MGSGLAKTPSAAERLARLYRVAQDGELEESSRDLIKELLFAEIASLVTPASSVDGAPATALSSQESKAPHAGESANDAPVLAPANASQGSGPLRAGAGAGALGGAQAEDRLMLRLRQLIFAEAGWEQIEPVALAIFQHSRTGAAAARMLELALLHADTVQIEGLLQRFCAAKGAPDVKGFYQLVHPQVRAHLVARLWRERRREILITLLMKDRDEAYLVPIERLFVFQELAATRDATTPYMYFRSWQEPLRAAAASVGSYVGISLGAFLLRVGQLALDLGFVDFARSVLEQIPSGGPERDQALSLMLAIANQGDQAGHGPYVAMLLGERSAAGRLQLLAEFLATTRSLGGFKDQHRPALNEILKDPLSWFVDDAEAWGTLSELLVANSDLAPLLPSLMTVFRVNAKQFFPPRFDAALWQGPLRKNVEPGIDAGLDYWRGVALLHQYVTMGPSSENLLWEAQELSCNAQRSALHGAPWEWRELHKAAFVWVAKSHFLLEADRSRMLRQLRVALPPSNVAVVDIEDYIAHSEAAPVQVLKALERVAQGKPAPQLEQQIILRRAQLSHLTNGDLSRIWQLANDRQDADLAWRAATVLNARLALCAPVRLAWEISGEKRATYGYAAASKKVTERCLAGFAPRHARLAFACLHVGPLLPELLSMLDPGATSNRYGTPPGDSIEAQVDKALADLPWLAPHKKSFRFSFETAQCSTGLPAFIQILPTNQWSILVARLAELLGINAWGWKLSHLCSQISDLIPRLASRQDLRRYSDRVAKWLKELSPEQRAAWQDLAALARGMDDDEAGATLAMFICRLATVILPNHQLALTSLQTMRAPVQVLWDLEAWLLSEDYSAVRRELGTQNRVLVPNALQRLESIVATKAS